MKILIIGAGTQGKFIARTLANDDNFVTVIDRDFKAEELLSFVSNPHVNLDVIIGDGCDYDILERAGCDSADVVFSCTGDDEDNLVVSLLAKQEFGVPKVLARINNPENKWLFNDHWGVDRGVSGTHILTSLVEEELTSDHIVGLLSFDDGKVELVEIRISQTSALVNKQLSDIELPKECSIVAILRNGHVVYSRDDTTLYKDDEIIILTNTVASEEVREIFEASL